MSGEGTAELTITGSQWLNLNDRLHWMRRARLTEEWREAAGWKAKSAKTPAFLTAWLIDATLLFSDNRRRDGHNWMPTIKAAIDGLVDVGVLRDDSSSNLHAVRVQIGEPDRGLKCPTLVLRIEGFLMQQGESNDQPQ